MATKASVEKDLKVALERNDANKIELDTMKKKLRDALAEKALLRSETEAAIDKTKERMVNKAELDELKTKFETVTEEVEKLKTELEIASQEVEKKSKEVEVAKREEEALQERLKGVEVAEKSLHDLKHE